MKAFLSFAMSQGTWYARTFTFIYSDQEIQLTIHQQNYVQVMYMEVHPNYTTNADGTHKHSFMPPAESWL